MWAAHKIMQHSITLIRQILRSFYGQYGLCSIEEAFGRGGLEKFKTKELENEELVPTK